MHAFIFFCVSSPFSWITEELWMKPELLYINSCLSCSAICLWVFFLIKPESPYVCIVFSLQVVCFWGHPFQQISEFAWLLLAVLWCFQTSFLEKLSFCSRSYLLLPYCYVLYRYWGKLILNFLIPADSWGDSFMLVSSSFSPYPFLCFMFACGSLKSTVSFSDANVHYFSLPLR